MKPVKFVLLACSLLVLVAVFALPYLDVGAGMKFTLWKLHDKELGGLVHPYVVAFAALIPAIFGAIGLASKKLPRWQSIVSLVFFAIGLFMSWAVFKKTQTHFGHDGAIGAKLIVTALLGGLAASIAGIVKPERSLA
jgi:hypothetical protein